MRKPNPDDWEAVFVCLAAYNLHRLADVACADPDFSYDAILSMRNSVCHIDLAEKCWVATADDQVVGFCCWDWIDREGSIAKTVLISVARSARSLGVGALLQQRRLDEMVDEGARVHTWSDDPRAIDWYQKRFGYDLLGHEPTRHCLHRFHLGEHKETWALHRGLTERDTLAHLRLSL